MRAELEKTTDVQPLDINLGQIRLIANQTCDQSLCAVNMGSPYVLNYTEVFSCILL